MNISLPFFIILSILFPIFSPVFANNSSGSIFWWCSQVPYPDTCNYHLNDNILVPLESSSSSTTLQKNQFINLLQHATMNYTVDTIDRIKSLGPKRLNENQKTALSGCLELYEKTVMVLNDRSFAAHDKQMNLCGVMANYETCLDGFVDLNVTYNILPLIANNASKLISNILAVNIEDSEEKEQSYSYLDDDFPSWFSEEDRLDLKLSSPRANVVVAQDGTGNFRTIGQALTASFKRTTPRFVIYVKKGIYKEYLNITPAMNKITLIGDGAMNTIITGYHSVAKGYTSYSSATVGVSGDGFIAKGITFQNTAGPQGHQAVALRSDADFSVFYRCAFLGYQDTLLIQSKRQFFKQCTIYGTADFIWGNAAVVLQECWIYVRNPPRTQGYNVITAQGRSDPRCPTGIVIHNSHVMASKDLAPSVKTYLGRPWKKYSRVIYMKTFIDSLIDPAGWLDWYSSHDTVYYAEYNNTGPGSTTNRRVKWPGYHIIKDSNTASQFDVANFIRGQSWLPATNVPFTAGL